MILLYLGYFFTSISSILPRKYQVFCEVIIKYFIT